MSLAVAVMVSVLPLRTNAPFFGYVIVTVGGVVSGGIGVGVGRRVGVAVGLGVGIGVEVGSVVGIAVGNGVGVAEGGTGVFVGGIGVVVGTTDVGVGRTTVAVGLTYAQLSPVPVGIHESETKRIVPRATSGSRSVITITWSPAVIETEVELVVSPSWLLVQAQVFAGIGTSPTLIAQPPSIWR